MSIFILGAGPQISNSVANIFAEHGFTVGLASRSSDNLKRYAAMLPEGTKVAVATCDAADPASCTTALDKLQKELGKPSVIVWNAGSLSMGPKPIADMTPSDMEKHLSMNVVSGFAVMQWASKNVVTEGGKKAAIFVTGGGLSLQPRKGMSGLAVGKAALLNLAEAFRVETSGIHIATVIVKGFVDKGDPFYASPLIAKEYWKLYSEEGEQNWSKVIEH